MAADLALDSLDTDLLVLGAGGAGLCAALHAADRSPRLTVTVAVKGLLGRAGWSLWLAYDLPGSFEEGPASLIEEMQRDRRWCQGNLQHLRLLLTEGLRTAHRALFLNGILAYVSALLWLVFLSLSTAEAVLLAVRGPDYFPYGRSLFPAWPEWRP